MLSLYVLNYSQKNVLVYTIRDGVYYYYACHVEIGKELAIAYWPCSTFMKCSCSVPYKFSSTLFRGKMKPDT